RATNVLVAIDDEDTFVEAVLAGLGRFPTYFSRLPEVNRRGPRLYGTPPALPTLGLEAFRAAIARGALVVYARPIVVFSEPHILNALSIELRPVFASWLGWLVDADRELIFVLDDHQDASEVVRQC